MNVRDERFRSVLRAFVLVMAALALAAVLLGALPGHERYVDGVLVERIRTQGGESLLFVVAPGFLVWRRPTLSTAIGWCVLTWFIGFMLALSSIGGDDPEGIVVTLWPAEVVEVLGYIVASSLLWGLPVAVVVYALYRAATRHWDVELPDVPTARVVGTLKP